MGQLGIGELMIIFVIALLVFGPKKLPELGKSLGKGLKEFKKATDDLKSNWDEHTKDFGKTVDDIKSTVKDATDDIKRSTDVRTNFYEEYDNPEPPAEEPPAKVEEAHKEADPKSDDSKDDARKEVHQA